MNDTLRISVEQGFPAHILNLERHRRKPITADELSLMVFGFHSKKGVRRYHPAPIRNFLVQDIDGKWLYWGKILMLMQIVEGEDAETNQTSGKYRVLEIYDPVYQRQITMHESPSGLSYFSEKMFKEA